MVGGCRPTGCDARRQAAAPDSERIGTPAKLADVKFAILAEAAGSSAEAGPSAAGASAEAEDPLATQDQGGTADAEELENLDLSEGMDTGENADDGSLR